MVAHGAPSDPEPLDGVLRALAGRISTLAPGLDVRGATLAKPGSLEAALADAGPDRPIRVYPFFMSDGFFVRRELRRRVAEAARSPIAYLDPFGLDPRLPELCIRRAQEAVVRLGRMPGEAVLILAAHGSRSNPASSEATRMVQGRIVEAGVFRDVRIGFVEEPPSITDAASDLGGNPAVCLPLFATTAGHVESDIPAQLAAAGFAGTLLPPIGEDDEVAALIAAALETIPAV